MIAYNYRTHFHLSQQEFLSEDFETVKTNIYIMESLAKKREMDEKLGDGGNNRA